MSGHPLARSEGIISEEVGDELVVYDEGTQTAHCLSTDAVLVWRRCDGRSSVKDIAGRLGLEQAWVAQALDELSGVALLEEPDGISRRALYKRVAKLGAAAVSAPLIYSVAIAPASAHASSAVCGTSLGAACVAAWTPNEQCSGPPDVDTCSAETGLLGCSCQDLGECISVPGSSRRLGTCAPLPG